MNRILLIVWLATLVGLLYAGGPKGQQQVDVSPLRSDIEALRHQVSSLRNDHSTLESRVNSLSSTVDSVKRDRDSLQSDLDEAKRKISDSISRSDIDSLRSELGTVRSSLESVEASLPRNLKKDLAELRKSDADNDRDFERLNAETAKLRHADESLSEIIANLKKTLDLHSARLEQVKKQTHIKAWVP